MARFPPVSSEPLRALIYNRVSADPTGRRISTASQDEENRAFCASQGWSVVASVTDDDRSASRHATRARQGYAQVRDALAGQTLGRIDVLVCWEASRAGRDLDDYVALRRLCAEHAVLLAYRGKVYDLTEGSDRFSTGLDALVAERESEQIRDRILRSHRKSVEQGSPRGVIPYGYMRVYDRGTGHMTGQVPDPNTAPVVQEIVRRFLAGETLWRIASDLNARGVPSPRAYRLQSLGREGETAGWSNAAMRKMLTKHSLMGVRSHLGQAVGEASWEAIVSPADWAKVQQILADPARVPPRGVAASHLLSGIAECGVCGAWMRVAKVRTRPMYRCQGLGQGMGLAHVARAEAALDRFVERPLLRRLQRPDVLALLAPAGEVTGDVATAQRELADLEARLEGFVVSAAEGGVSPTALAAIEARLLPQIEEARVRAVPRSLPPALLEVARPDAPAVWDRWGAEPGGLGKKRQVVRALLRVVVHRASVRGVRAFDASTVELSWRGSAAAPE
jgi:site-specific DNA recombinase